MNLFIITHGEKELINCIERDLNSLQNVMNTSSTSNNKCLHLESKLSILVNWLNQLTATLDCYTSLFKENIIDNKLLKNPCSR